MSEWLTLPVLPVPLQSGTVPSDELSYLEAEDIWPQGSLETMRGLAE